MFNLGAPEIMVILVVALIVLGPKRLPQAGRQVARALAEFRQVTSDAKSDLQDAFAVDELREAFGVDALRRDLGVDGMRDSFDLRKVLSEPEKARSRGGPTDLSSAGRADGLLASGYVIDVPPPDGLQVDTHEDARVHASESDPARAQWASVPPPPPAESPDPLQGLYTRSGSALAGEPALGL